MKKHSDVFLSAAALVLFIVAFTACSHKPVQTQKDLAEQLLSLAPGDIIEDSEALEYPLSVFRKVLPSGQDLLVVDWIGARGRSVSVGSLARRPGKIRIIRQTDPKWIYYAKRFFAQ